MAEFCEVAIEKLVDALTGWAESQADFEKSQHECYIHEDEHACTQAKHIGDELPKAYQNIKNLIEDMQLCMRHLPAFQPKVV